MSEAGGTRPSLPTPEELEAHYARLFDRVGSFAAIARLTDRQKAFLFKDHDGARGERSPEVPEISEDLPQIEQDRIALFDVGRALGVPMEDLVREWDRKYPGEPTLR